MNEMGHTGGMSARAVAWSAVLGGVAFIVAFAVFMNERQGPGDANYSFALLLLGIGAFLVLIAVIASSGRRDG